MKRIWRAAAEAALGVTLLAFAGCSDDDSSAPPAPTATSKPAATGTAVRTATSAATSAPTQAATATRTPDQATATPETEIPTPTATPTPTEPLATPTACASDDGTASLTATSASPASGQGPLEGSCVTAENAGGTRGDLTRVSTRGTVNGVAFLLQVYFVTATGEIDTVSYGWDPSPEIPDFFQNLAFCNAPGCGGASMSLATKTITLDGTALGGDGGASAVLDGTITLERIPESLATPTPACPGGSATLDLTEIQGTNSSQPLPATLELGAAMNFSRPADPPVYAYLSALYDGCPMPFPRLSLGFQFSGAELQPGTTYQVGSIDGNLNQIEFREDGFSSFRSWEARSGTLVVDAIDDGTVSFRIVGAQMRPRDAGTTGTFVLNATGLLAPTP